GDEYAGGEDNRDAVCRRQTAVTEHRAVERPREGDAGRKREWQTARQPRPDRDVSRACAVPKAISPARLAPPPVINTIRKRLRLTGSTDSGRPDHGRETTSAHTSLSETKISCSRFSQLPRGCANAACRCIS